MEQVFNILKFTLNISLVIFMVGSLLDMGLRLKLGSCSDFGFWATHGKFYFKVR